MATKKKGKGKKPAGTAAAKKHGALKVGGRVEVVGEGCWAKGAVGKVTKLSAEDRVHVRLDHKLADCTFPASVLKAL